jgi:hypothetical protein
LESELAAARFPLAQWMKAGSFFRSVTAFRNVSTTAGSGLAVLNGRWMKLMPAP